MEDPFEASNQSATKMPYRETFYKYIRSGPFTIFLSIKEECVYIAITHDYFGLKWEAVFTEIALYSKCGNCDKCNNCVKCIVLNKGNMMRIADGVYEADKYKRVSFVYPTKFVVPGNKGGYG